MEKWPVARIVEIMLQDKYSSKLKELPEPARQLVGLVVVTIVVILSFAIFNIFFGHDKDLTAKMKREEEKIAEKRKLSDLLSNLPTGILVTYDGTNGFKLSDELYEKVCNATKLITQRTIMGANLINLKAYQIYTGNGNQVKETFVKWDNENKKCVANSKTIFEGDAITIDGSSGEIFVFLVQELIQEFILLKIFRNKI